MSNYTPEEVDMLIEMLRTRLQAKAAVKAVNTARTPSDGRNPFPNKTERTIRYLEQRHKFFNPTKQMLEYIVGIAEDSGLDENLVKKMKEDLLTKR